MVGQGEGNIDRQYHRIPADVDWAKLDSDRLKIPTFSFGRGSWCSVSFDISALGWCAHNTMTYRQSRPPDVVGSEIFSHQSWIFFVSSGFRSVCLGLGQSIILVSWRLLPRLERRADGIASGGCVAFGRII